MVKKYKLIIIITLILLIIGEPAVVNADSIDSVEKKNILIIASYTYNNEWENKIIKGIKDYYYSSNYIKIEHLDSEAFTSRDYYGDFLDLLNIKYRSEDIDYIITLDDEAFDFVLTYMFNRNAVFNRKPVFCLGLNNVVNITDEEKKYVSGIIDTQNGKEFLKLIKSASPKVEDIYLLLDESAYCEAFGKSILEGNSEIDTKFNINYIRSNYIEDIEEQIKGGDSSSSALILAGTFYDKDTEHEVDGADTVNFIKSCNDAALYATLEEYVKQGALGGLVNDGYNLGKVGAEQLDSIIKNNMNYYTFSIVSNLFDICLINYKSMRYYGVSPFNLPGNTTYLDKGKYDLLLSDGMIMFINSIIIFVTIFIIVLFILLFKHKRKIFKAKKQLFDSEEREKIKTDFIILLSHELRTPLNIIINTSKLLKLKCINDEYEKEYFLEKMNYSIKNSNRLLKSINNSIDLAKIESNVIDTNFNMENIVEVIDEIIDVTADFAKSYDVEIIFDPEEEVIETAIDKDKITRILLNLISNAVKNINKQGRIFIKCSKDISNVYISVEDNGIGISEANKKQIFEKFFQVSPNTLNRLNEGSGMGLYITKKLVEMHDGTIDLESTLGKGTTFNIILPIKVVDEESDSGNFVNGGINELASLEFSDVIHKNNSEETY